MVCTSAFIGPTDMLSVDPTRPLASAKTQLCHVRSVPRVGTTQLASMHAPTARYLYYVFCIVHQTFCLTFSVFIFELAVLYSLYSSSNFLCYILCINFKISVLRFLYSYPKFMCYVLCIHSQNYCIKFSVFLFSLSELYFLYSSAKFLF